MHLAWRFHGHDLYPRLPSMSSGRNSNHTPLENLLQLLTVGYGTFSDLARCPTRVRKMRPKRTSIRVAVTNRDFMSARPNWRALWLRRAAGGGAVGELGRAMDGGADAHVGGA